MTRPSNGLYSLTPRGENIPDTTGAGEWMSEEAEEQIRRIHGDDVERDRIRRREWANDPDLVEFLDPENEELRQEIRRIIDFKPHFHETKHGMSVTLRIDDGLMKAIDTIVARKELPFPTRSEFIREACYHFAQAMKLVVREEDPAIEEALNELVMGGYRDAVRTHQENLRSAAEGLRDGLLGFYDRGDRLSAYRQLYGFYLRFRHLEPSYAAPYLRLLKEIPIARQVAWDMRESHSALPDEYTPKEDPRAGYAEDEWEDELYSDIGVPIPVHERIEARKKLGRPGRGRPRKNLGLDDDDLSL